MRGKRKIAFHTGIAKHVVSDKTSARITGIARFYKSGRPGCNIPDPGYGERREILIWSTIMSAVMMKNRREELFRGISNVLQQWSDLERKIFAQAHYQGRSPKTISDSLKLDVNEVRSVLRKCDHDLHISLREFRKSDGSEAELIRTAS